MREKLDSFIKEFQKGNKTNISDVDQLKSKLDFPIDTDYFSLIGKYDGIRGTLENGEHLLVWKTQEVIQLNPYYDDVEECENLFFFGTNGSNLGYAFDKKDGNIVSIDFIEISESKPNFIAKSIIDFLLQVNKDNGKHVKE